MLNYARDDVDDDEVGIDPVSPPAHEVPGGSYVSIKYVTERALAALMSVVLLPLIAAIALCVRLTLGRGVFFPQDRVGRFGSVFTMYKFRTMEPDRRVHALVIDADRRMTHKTPDDPRHTRLGRLLRRTSLDELPQLLNVVKGEMTLVGPRPELESVVQERGLRDHARHLLKPGITGLWQVSQYRHELLHENLHVDLEYLETVSLRTDLSILARTASSMWSSTGS